MFTLTVYVACALTVLVAVGDPWAAAACFVVAGQAEIPIQIIFPGVFAVILYLLAGLPLGAKAFLLFIVFTVLTANAAVSMG